MKKLLVAAFGVVFGTVSAYAACSSNEIDVNGDGTNCQTAHFSIGTTNIPANDEVKFRISARGTFYVDCGDGGTLSGDVGVSGKTITRSNTSKTITRSNTSNDSYLCTYSTSGTKTMRFGGVATEYGYISGWGGIPAISFDGNSNISSVDGNMSAMFPYLGAGNGLEPVYAETFYGCTNLTSISGTLFSNYTTGTFRMFASTFEACTSLQSIPSGLFANITTGAEAMFANTFADCDGLQSIPSGLFANITTGAEYMFFGAFNDCTSLQSIPSGLFANITTGAEHMFESTFFGCTSLQSIPSDLFANITTGADYMFEGTFVRCESLQSIPSGLFANITTGADNMFAGTFYDCRNLSGVIPGNLFAGLIANGSPNYNNFMHGIFDDDSGLASECPAGTTEVETPYSQYWDGKVACSDPLN